MPRLLVTCPHCETDLVAEANCGQTIQCWKCGGTFMAPPRQQQPVQAGSCFGTLLMFIAGAAIFAIVSYAVLLVFLTH